MPRLGRRSVTRLAAELAARPGVDRRCAVLGSPVGRSLSPLLHRAAYAALGLGWRYDAYEVDAAGLPAFVSALGPEWVGLSLTRPLKGAALGLADEIDQVARRTGAANTLLLGERRRASNTDVGGLRAVLASHDLLGPQQVCVLGAGATARSALVALDGSASDVVVAARDPARAGDLGRLELSYRVRVVGLGDDDARREALGRPLVVNTTPAGALDRLGPEVSRANAGLGSAGRGGADPPAVVASGGSRSSAAGRVDESGTSAPLGSGRSGAYLDVVYDPWPTPLAAAYRSIGRAVVGGLELLVHQAALQVEAMTGRPAPIDAMWAAVPAGDPVDDDRHSTR